MGRLRRACEIVGIGGENCRAENRADHLLVTSPSKKSFLRANGLRDSKLCLGLRPEDGVTLAHTRQGIGRAFGWPNARSDDRLASAVASECHLRVTGLAKYAPSRPSRRSFAASAWHEFFWRFFTLVGERLSADSGRRSQGRNTRVSGRSVRRRSAWALK